jgi:hypothetical protein
MEHFEWTDATPLREVNPALAEVVVASGRMHDPVAVTRGGGFSWANIYVLGTSGESARQRHGVARCVGINRPNCALTLAARYLVGPRFLAGGGGLEPPTS